MQERIITESFISAVEGTDVLPIGGDFSLSISGTFVGTVEVQRSFDDKATWLPIEAFTAVTEQVGFEASVLAHYRFECTAFTSGTIVARLTQ